MGRLVGGGAMPLITGVDHKRREVTVLAIGPITMDDVREHVAHMKRDGGLAYPRIVESRGAGLPADPGDFQKLADMLRDLSKEGAIGPAAIIVSSVADVERMRVLENMLASYCPVKAFRTEEDARAWLQEISAEGKST
jgi:hypothetical protein